MTGLTYRKIKNQIFLSLFTMLAFTGLFWLLFILWDLIVEGVTHLNLSLFVKDPSPPGFDGGGLRNAFVGHLLVTGGALLIAVPLGVLGGTYISEFGRENKFSHWVKVVSDIMMSVPTIVIGGFVFVLFVKPFSQFNGWAGSFALSIILIPLILRNTAEMLQSVPWQLREAAYALGAPKHSIILKVVYRGAISGVLSGILLALARIVGETAPLLFTAFNSSLFTTDMTDAMPTLTVTIFQYALGPFDEWHSLAWAASLVLVMAILAMTVLARILLSHHLKKHNLLENPILV